MKRISLVLVLALLAVLLVNSEALSAPTAVSIKSGPSIVGLYGLEVAIGVSDHFSVVVQGGSIFPLGTVLGALVGNPFDYITVGVGARYYFRAEGWRPFVTLYGDYHIDVFNSEIAENYFSFPVTVGIEFQREKGFHFSFEAGASYIPTNQEAPIVPAFGLSLGYGF